MNLSSPTSISSKEDCNNLNPNKPLAHSHATLLGLARGEFVYEHSQPKPFMSNYKRGLTSKVKHFSLNIRWLITYNNIVLSDNRRWLIY